jgi:hypothetical protein
MLTRKMLPLLLLLPCMVRLLRLLWMRVMGIMEMACVGSLFRAKSRVCTCHCLYILLRRIDGADRGEERGVKVSTITSQAADILVIV